MIHWTAPRKRFLHPPWNPLEPRAAQNLRGHYLFRQPRRQFRAGISDDLRVPWGWLEVALFVILGVIGSVVVTWGAGRDCGAVFRGEFERSVWGRR